MPLTKYEKQTIGLGLGVFAAFMAIVILIGWATKDFVSSITAENIGKAAGEIVRSYNETVRGEKDAPSQ